MTGEPMQPPTACCRVWLHCAVQSVLQVGLNPGRPVMYGGCALVVLGAFVQFYMRAGIFTDGGKREREKAAAKARLRLEAKTGKASPAPTVAEADKGIPEVIEQWRDTFGN